MTPTHPFSILASCLTPEGAWADVRSSFAENEKGGSGKTKAFAERYRPQFRYTPERTWMNDPNGLVYHDGVSVFAEGGRARLIRLDAWSLRSIWRDR